VTTRGAESPPPGRIDTATVAHELGIAPENSIRPITRLDAFVARAIRGR
jgi:hypothetical protein